MMDKMIVRLPKIKPLLGLLAGFSVLQALFIVGQAYFLSRIITNLWEGKEITSQFLYLFFFLLSFAGRHLITLMRERRLYHYAETQAKSIRVALLEKIFLLGPQIVQKEGSGNLITMAMEGIDQVENYIQLILTKMINMTVIPIVVVATVFYFDKESGFILLIVFPIIILFMIILGYAAQSKAAKQYKLFQILSNHFIDSLRGLETLKLFGLSKKYGKSIYQTSERFRKATMSTLKIAILSTFALDFFTTLSIAVVAVMLGLRLINGTLLLFPALTVLILAPEYFLPLREFASDYHATLDGKNAMSSIGQLLNKSVPTQRNILPSFTWNASSELNLAQLSFHYPENDVPSVQAVSFDWKGFGKIGVIGGSGSGKTTLINLLSGFSLPDDTSKLSVNHTEIPHFSQENWQVQLTYIPQNPYLFHGSLRDNICFYTPDASDEAVLEAIEKAGLAELLRKLPEGLHTNIGEGGRQLSGGQMQRVVLARAFLNDQRKVLLFDEPTAHLDIETEWELKQNIIPLMEEKLVFFATHRLHWMKEMDYILVMDHGRLVEAGTHEELIQRKGMYVSLIQELRGENNEN